jgi:hypothetical protein
MDVLGHSPMLTTTQPTATSCRPRPDAVDRMNDALWAERTKSAAMATTVGSVRVGRGRILGIARPRQPDLGLGHDVLRP